MLPDPISDVVQSALTWLAQQLLTFAFRLIGYANRDALDDLGTDEPVPMGEPLPPPVPTGETMACCDLDDAEAAEMLGL